ncbi:MULTISPECIES: cupin domain-containing protein [Paraburkholderia]|uniref:Cupin domain-containing protein n=1 Tax=Paraburkholderia dipogonis TaxID=1211383 RepID=A0A4Y8MHV2_9BURK|nr:MULTISPECIES: cupin domain-containing protein [Paraburkholderia]TFE37032.1 cupin domain-containing protein [Paraburkholderia dipogonis]
MCVYTKQIDQSTMRPENGVLVCRLLEHLPAGLTTAFGTSIVEVVPAGAVDLHSHSEHELWILISGKGVFEVNGQARPVADSTLLYIEPNQEHAIRNADPAASLKFLSIWWD